MRFHRPLASLRSNSRWRRAYRDSCLSLCHGWEMTCSSPRSKKGIASLCRLYNAILHMAHFPSEWKTRWKQGKIIVLPKSGNDPRLPSSSRPMMLLPHVATLFEGLLLRRILTSSSPNCNQQFGLRSTNFSRDTTAQLARGKCRFARKLLPK